jgi:hypothetical protein
VCVSSEWDVLEVWVVEGDESGVRVLTPNPGSRCPVFKAADRRFEEGEEEFVGNKMLLVTMTLGLGLGLRLE